MNQRRALSERRRDVGRVIIRLGSRTRPGAFYTVRMLSGGTLTCDCTGYLCSSRSTCRHVEIVDCARQLAPEIALRTGDFV